MPNHELYRYQHTYILGASGTGKSTLLNTFVIESILRGEGLIYFDFHGESIDSLLSHIPPQRIPDTILFDPSYPSPINLFENVTERPVTAMAVLDLFRSLAKYDPQMSTPIFDQFVLYGAHALFHRPDATLLDLKYLLTSKTFREDTIQHISDPIVREFWEYDFLQIKDVQDKMQSVLNKINVLLADERIRRIISYPRSAIDLAAIRDNQRILLVRIPQAKFGLEGARTIGRIILTSFYSVALQSQNPFHVFIDEAHNLQGPIMEEMLASIRRQNISITLAHQYLNQLTPSMKQAVLGNTGTKIVFRVGVDDAAALEEILPGNNNLFWLYEMPAFRARMQTPVSEKTIELDIEPPQFPSYQRSTKEITALARERYRFNKNRIDKHIERVREQK